MENVTFLVKDQEVQITDLKEGDIFQIVTSVGYVKSQRYLIVEPYTEKVNGVKVTRIFE